MSTLLPAIEIETAPNPSFAVIWLHGLGADGHDFEPIVPFLNLPKTLGVRFIFPHAPSIPVTCNGGYVMPAWYDITRIDALSREVDEVGLQRTCSAIRRWIAHENARGVPTGNIVVAGFSQGGAVAYSLGLTHPERLAGIIALSTYLPAPDQLAQDLSGANRKTPIFAAHGSADDVVALPFGLQACDVLLQRQYELEWHTYPMAHSLCDEEITDLGRWLTARFSEE